MAELGAGSGLRSDLDLPRSGTSDPGPGVILAARSMRTATWGAPFPPRVPKLRAAPPRACPGNLWQGHHAADLMLQFTGGRINLLCLWPAAPPAPGSRSAARPSNPGR